MGLFDRIKKSLFGKKDEEDENKKEEKQTEQENEAKPESEDNDQESEKVVDEAKSKTETTDEEEQTVEAQEDSEVEAESGDEEKAVDLDSKQQPEEVKVEETTETETEEQLYEKGLEKTNKGFGARLNAFFAKFRTVDEDFFDDLEDLLIESDVGYETAEQLTDELREEAKLQNAKSRDDLKRVIVEKLVDLYDKGGNSEDEQLTYNAEAKPNVYLFVGVNGAGKTTTIGKLAKRFKDEGKSVILAAADTFRAGAVEQLVEWGNRVDVPVVTGKEKADPASVVYDATERAIREKADYLLVDTAGRLQNKKNLMAELEKIQRTIKKLLPDQPTETLLVLDGSTGQNALLQAKDFDKTTELTGLVLTKLDGSSKGGVVLAIRNEMNLPVKLVGLGERAEDLADFDAANYAIGLFHGLV
ncbi:signal recognition particle-docking protein FtsY [Lactobacillus crispatus]|uniref:Signal recognition particle receptor FtsY n=1 Tax=Lactobacillus crispatus TaxID=47770 RepID=A0ABV2B6Y0_9LACO|nr:signal recognition particle-docking protein FtsY [Lactobacillus crispatus]EEU28282.1 signal recognition particle-docking protein FtsY [Lactobacillus crispatus MV-1A-US]KXI17140.1 signal recognition particle-docking protein FtsY [Lactobacillus crispatus]MCZ3862718.1 signal recognition particle-docking protein FtsY [Lactobacillus crispatus]MCZ3918603.1 signal recognition particle-docking protein FtsY [Lactobacillus crispatus]MCZ3920775.1 signal recognition particle-docking protein FtsY [Lacto